MNTLTWIWRRVPHALVAVTVVCGLAACGSSSNSNTSTDTGTATTTASNGAGPAGFAARRAALAACLKKHGVTLPTPPAGSPGSPGAGTPPRQFGPPGAGPRRRGFFHGFSQNPKFRVAFKACAPNFGRGGFGFHRPSAVAIQKYVACVRQHGYNLPEPNLSGNGPVFPPGIRSSAKFQAASRTCQRLLVPAFRGGGPGGGPNSPPALPQSRGTPTT